VTAGADVEAFDPADAAREEEVLWARLISERSPAARDELFSLHLPFARRLAKRHFKDRTGADIEFRDFCQLAYAGLLEAIDRFEPSRGVPFQAYAGRRISGSVLDGLSKMSELREQIASRKRIRSERARSLTPVDVESLSGPESLAALSELAVGLALGFMLEDTGAYAPDELGDARPNAYESLAWKETIGQLLDEVSGLPEREQTVIRRHYLEGLSFDQIANLLAISKGRVSQLHKAGLERLRRRLPGQIGFHLER
jgi:RNA polymerase sigma factor for flagellar operon FliA